MECTAIYVTTLSADLAVTATNDKETFDYNARRDYGVRTILPHM